MAACGIDLNGATTLVEMAALMAGARLYIGIDNGLSHLAAAANPPSLVLYGPSGLELHSFNL